MIVGQGDGSSADALKRVAAAVVWLTAAGASAWAMVLWMAIVRHGVGGQRRDQAEKCGARIGEPYGAPDSVELHFWAWDCIGSSDELVYRSWLPLIGWAVALLPQALFIGLILYVGRMRRTPPAQRRGIRELLHVAGKMAAAVVATGAAFVGYLAAGPHRFAWLQIPISMMLVAAWIAWALALRRALRFRAPREPKPNRSPNWNV